MSLLEQLNQDMKQAMKQKDKEKLTTIRMLKASLQNEAIKLQNNQLSEDDELTLLSKELKQRNDSLQEFKSAQRNDLVEKLETEIRILQQYMPKQLSDAELEAIVQSTVKEVNATTKNDMGKVMNAVMPKIKGKADGSQVNKLVQKYLS